MKRLAGLILSVLISCCGFASDPTPITGKFAIQPDVENVSYIILKENFRFAYSHWGHGEYDGNWEYVDDATIKISFDEPKTLADHLSSPRPTAYIEDTIKIVSPDVLLIKEYSVRSIREREYIRVPEE